MNNLLAKPQKAIGIRQQISSMYNFSHKLPIYINKYVNFWEKLKNILIWKDIRKTQIFIFFYLILFIWFYLFGCNWLYYVFVFFR